MLPLLAFPFFPKDYCSLAPARAPFHLPLRGECHSEGQSAPKLRQHHKGLMWVLHYCNRPPSLDLGSYKGDDHLTFRSEGLEVDGIAWTAWAAEQEGRFHVWD